MAHWLNILGWLLSVVTIVGNGFVVGLLIKNRQLHSSANWFVLSLAVADFMIGFAVFPLQYLCIERIKCDLIVNMAFFWFFLHSSVSNLCTLTWDRYIAIVHPYRYTNFVTTTRPGLVITAAWLIPFAISLLLSVGMYATDSRIAWKVLRLIGVSAFDIISCMLLLYAVVRILFVARQARIADAIQLQVQSNQCRDVKGTAGRRKRPNAARFVVAIVVFFLGCYALVNYFILCIIFSYKIPGRAGQILNVLLVLNSAVNPVVYAFFKKDIKTHMKKLFCNWNKKREEHRKEEVPSR
ncbi:octopamine receptor beta-2R-like [Stylophora pistillata]|uniref:octopamine receptor beta-2R-like n=1 Tax=Stylophora pistillata TaxID=50429 RepID=UPI000C039289|nr:octopamine receptor beta-2R-like [Stylophora pistillata]